MRLNYHDSADVKLVTSRVWLYPHMMNVRGARDYDEVNGPRDFTRSELFRRIVVATLAVLLAVFGEFIPAPLRWGLVGAAVTVLALESHRLTGRVEVAFACAGAWGVCLMALAAEPGLSSFARIQLSALGILTMAGVVIYGRRAQPLVAAVIGAPPVDAETGEPVVPEELVEPPVAPIASE